MHDGGKFKLIQKLPPNLIYAVLCVNLWWFLNCPGFDDNPLMLFSGVAVLVAWANLQKSYGGWENWRTVFRFVPLIAVSLPLAHWLDAWQWFGAYAIALLVLGALRPMFSKYAPTVKNWTRYVEFCEGAVVFGGLAAVAF